MPSVTTEDLRQGHGLRAGARIQGVSPRPPKGPTPGSASVLVVRHKTSALLSIQGVLLLARSRSPNASYRACTNAQTQRSLSVFGVLGEAKHGIQRWLKGNFFVPHGTARAPPRREHMDPAGAGFRLLGSPPASILTPS